MPKRIFAYECKFCKTIKRSHYICNRHEQTCLKNPESVNCLNCTHMMETGKGAVCALDSKLCNSVKALSCGRFNRVKGEHYE